MTNRLADSTEPNCMLTSIRLRNFKSYRDSGEVPLAPLTIIIGCNNAGKSAIIQPLLALKQTLADPSWRTRFVTSGPLVDLGGFFDIVHGGGEGGKKQIQIDITREPREMNFALNETELKQATRLHITFGFDKKDSRILIDKLELGDEKQAHATFSESGEWNIVGLSQKVKKRINVTFRNFLVGIRPVQPRPNSKGEAKIDFDGFEQFMEVELQTQSWVHAIHSVVHVAPVRSHVPWYGGVARRYLAESGITGEELVRSLSSAEAIRDGKKSLLSQVNYWMSDRIEALKNIRLESLDKANLVRSLFADDPGGQAEINVAAMGEGISQMLPIIATTLHSSNGQTLIIEQPEIHLHPKAQADLGDLFVESTKNGNKQLIIETHSEHLLLRVRRHVAEGLISPDRVAVLYVEKVGGQSVARRLKLNGRGHFEDWPKGFFEEGYQEAMALAMAKPKAKQTS